MPRPHFVELIQSVESLPKHPLSGYLIVSDYTSAGKRHLFLRRAEAGPVRGGATPPARRQTKRGDPSTPPQPSS